jgi:phospholipase/carboxylesterase
MRTLQIDGPRVPPASGGAARKLVILLHGYGADGNDLIGLAPYFARHLPDAYFVAPNAPEPCEMAPSGFQWFPIGAFDPHERLHGVQTASPILNSFIDQELSRHQLGEADLALVGFSQGTMMSLHVALRRPQTVAGIVGFSGLLVAPERLPDEVQAIPPILLVHGDADEMLPVTGLFEAAQGLCAAGLSAQWHISEGVGHGIAEDGLELATDFLARVLA